MSRRLGLLLGVAVLVLGVALLATVVGAVSHDDPRPPRHDAAITDTASSDTASSDAAVAPAPRPARRERAAIPVRVEIPSIGVRAPVIKLGPEPRPLARGPDRLRRHRLVVGRLAPRRARPGGHRRPRRLEDGPRGLLPAARAPPGRRDRRRRPRRQPHPVHRRGQRAVPEGRLPDRARLRSHERSDAPPHHLRRRLRQLHRPLRRQHGRLRPLNQQFSPASEVSGRRSHSQSAAAGLCRARRANVNCGWVGWQRGWRGRSAVG